MPSFAENAAHLCEILPDVSIAEDETLVSFDVKALYTSVPLQPALDSVREALLRDQSWQMNTSLSAEEVVDLLNLCLQNISFQFCDKFYEMDSGLAMGLPVSPVVANIFYGKSRGKSYRRHADTT